MKFKDFDDISKYLISVAKKEDISILSYSDDIINILNSIMKSGLNVRFLDLEYDTADLGTYYLGLSYNSKRDYYEIVIYNAKNNENGYYYPRHGISIINDELYEEYNSDMKYYKEKFKYTPYSIGKEEIDKKEKTVKEDNATLKLFTDPKSGEINGYKAQWEKDGIKYRYEWHGSNNIDINKYLNLFK